MPSEYEPETDAALYQRHRRIEALKEEVERETDLLYLGCLENVENGVTVTHLARLLGVSRQWLHRALNGVRERREQLEASRPVTTGAVGLDSVSVSGLPDTPTSNETNAFTSTTFHVSGLQPGSAHYVSPQSGTNPGW